MSSTTLGNTNGTKNAVGNSADRILEILKRRGPQTSAALGAALGVSDEAARQQLVKLAAGGLVEGVSEANGVGRPMHIWRLTSTGHARFPDAHADLTVNLIRNIREELGEAALDRLIDVRERETAAAYVAEVADAADLGERIARLAAIRTREGYMAEWGENESGYLLVENHCPICAAATTCQGFCRAELAVFQEALGPDAQITRVEHIAAGARRCAYQITNTGAKTLAMVPS